MDGLITKGGTERNHEARKQISQKSYLERGGLSSCALFILVLCCSFIHFGIVSMKFEAVEPRNYLGAAHHFFIRLQLL